MARTTSRGALGVWAVTIISFAIIMAAPFEKAAAQNAFLRGDINADGRVSISDSLMLRRWLFNHDRFPPCHDAADFDDDGALNVTDTVSILNFLLADGPAPSAPFPGLGTDPTEDAWQCESYDVVEPEETDDVVELRDASGAPGGRVEIPVVVTNSREVEALQLVVRYDPSVFTPRSGRDGISFEGSFYESRVDPERTFQFAFVTPHAAEGIFLVGFVSHISDTGFELPAGAETIAFKIVGDISDSAPPGAVVRLDPTNGVDGDGWGPARMRNELTHRGEARFVSSVPRTDGMLLQIVGDQIFFRRGDANGDAEVNLSDAQFTLDYLFSSGGPPPCLDAADANDDGALNIADPIATLTFLFSRVASMPPPHPAAGPDPTEDALGCESQSG